MHPGNPYLSPLILKVRRVAAWAEDTILKECSMHRTVYFSNCRLQCWNCLSFYITTSFLCAGLVRCRESGGIFLLRIYNAWAYGKVDFSNAYPQTSPKCCSCLKVYIQGAAWKWFFHKELINESGKCCPHGIHGWCWWRSFARVILLSWLSPDFRADEVKSLSAGEGRVPFAASVYWLHFF